MILTQVSFKVTTKCSLFYIQYNHRTALKIGVSQPDNRGTHCDILAPSSSLIALSFRMNDSAKLYHRLSTNA